MGSIPHGGAADIDALTATLDRERIDGGYKIPCPAAGHAGDRSAKSVTVRLSRNGAPVVRCWSHDCDWREILRGLGYTQRARTQAIDGADIGAVSALIGDCADCGEGVVKGAVNGYPMLACGCGKPYQAHWARMVGAADGRRERVEMAAAYTLADGKPRNRIRIEPGKKLIWDADGKGRKTGGADCLLWGDADADDVVVCEGEKAAAALISAGVELAATWAGGAASAGSAVYRALAGKNATIWADNDQAGELAAEKLLRALTGLAASVRMVGVGGDAVDGADAADFKPSDVLDLVANAGETREVLIAAREARAGKLAKGAIPIDEPMAYNPPVGDGYDIMQWNARRVIAAHSTRLVVAGDQDTLDPARMYMARDDGRLSRSASVRSDILETVSSLYAQKAWAVLHGEEMGRALGFARRLANPKSWDEIEAVIVGVMTRDLKGGGKDGLPLGIGDTEFVHPTEIDRVGRFIGCANGVIDLDTLGANGYPVLLDAAAGRRALVSRTAGVEYKPDGGTDALGMLFGHVDDQLSDYLLDAFGFALRGYSGRGYLVTGDAGGGKTTLVETMVGAVGEYGGQVPVGALEYKRTAASAALSPEMLMFEMARLVGVSDLKPNSTIDSGTWKKATGGDMMTARGLYEKLARGVREFSSVSTVFISANPGFEPRFNLADGGNRRRLRILEYPGLPIERRKEDMRRRLIETPELRQQIFAELVRRAGKNRRAPDDIPTVAEATARARAESVGEDALAWIHANLVITGRNVDKLHTAAIHKAAVGAADAGEDKPTGKAWGYDQRAWTALIRTELELPATKKVKISGRVANGWQGIRFATDDERRQAQESDADGADGADSTPNDADARHERTDGGADAHCEQADMDFSRYENAPTHNPAGADDLGANVWRNAAGWAQAWGCSPADARERCEREVGGGGMIKRGAGIGVEYAEVEFGGADFPPNDARQAEPDGGARQQSMDTGAAERRKH